jgi:D-3-phosphoglycerate dehydrogenase
MTKVLITDQTHEVLEQRLRSAGFDVSVELNHDYESLVKASQDCDGLVVRSKVHIDKTFIDRVPSLRCIGRVGAGMETIDVDYAEKHGVRCLNSPEGNRDAVGEHTVGLLLAMLNNVARADAEVRRGLWQREANRGYELGSMTVGIIGFGNMGHAFACRLSGFGCRVVFYDKYLNGTVVADGVERVSLEQLQQESDVVSFHVPLTEETFHYFDAGFIEVMNKPFYLVNTARGAVVDTEALVVGLKSGKVRGAALDVLEYENMNADALGAVPSSVQYLLQSPHTVLTPHVAGWTAESKYKLASVLADKIINALK